MTVQFAAIIFIGVWFTLARLEYQGGLGRPVYRLIHALAVSGINALCVCAGAVIVVSIFAAAFGVFES